ncbi:MAG: type IX secretion system anionic LPS delivery protein PorZ, partial [Bacteroidia bacterium]
YQNWSTISGIPNGTYNGVVRYLGQIVANYSPYAFDGTQNKDTLYTYSGAAWTKLPFIAPPYTVKRLMDLNHNYLSLVSAIGFAIYDQSQASVFINNYPFTQWTRPANLSDVYVDFQAGPTYWIADLNWGLVKSLGPYVIGYDNENIVVNGTHSNHIGSVFVDDKGNVVTSPVVIDETGAGQYNPEQLNFYNGTDWSYIPEVDTIQDLNHAIIDPKDPKHIWGASWIKGLVEYKNGNVFKVYNSVNSVIPHIPGYNDWHRVSGLSFDGTGNLWVGCSDVKNFLSVRKTDGTLQNFDFSSIAPAVGRVLADKNDQIWVLFPRGNGIAVFKNNNFAPPNSTNTKFLTTSIGQGKLPDPYAYAIAEDLDGHIWIGTSVGVAVFYNPANITGGGDYDCQQILITQDSHVQILLETEKVNAIAVDGANQKWVGTDASGVFCFSPDGQTEIFHFTTDNSPLFSNTIIDISYDAVTGDIYIGTDQGLQSYRGAIVKAEDDFTNVHAYPNPVRPGYAGSVYVRGLVSETIVKITDISGNLVWETKSQGGQIEWPLKNLNGQKVASGIYMAYCSTSDGTKSTSTKIMVVN